MGGEAEPARLALEQWVTQMAFQPGNLPTHGALREVQQFGCTGEVAALGSDQEGVQRRQGWEAFHQGSHDVRTWQV